MSAELSVYNLDIELIQQRMNLQQRLGEVLVEFSQMEQDLHTTLALRGQTGQVEGTPQIDAAYINDLYKARLALMTEMVDVDAALRMRGIDRAAFLTEVRPTHLGLGDPLPAPPQLTVIQGGFSETA